MNELTIPQWIEVLDRRVSALEKTDVDETLPESHGTISRADGTAERIAGTHKIVPLEVWNELKGDCDYWKQQAGAVERERDEWKVGSLQAATSYRRAAEAIHESRESLSQRAEAAERERDHLLRNRADYREEKARAEANQAAADTLERLKKGEAIHLDNPTGGASFKWRLVRADITSVYAERDALEAKVEALIKAVDCQNSDYRTQATQVAACEKEKADLERRLAEAKQAFTNADRLILDMWNAAGIQSDIVKKLADLRREAAKNAELDDQLNRGRAQLLQAGNEKAALTRQLAEQEARENEAEREWTDIVYYLVDAVGPRRGKSISEDVEHAVAELRRNDERWKMLFTWGWPVKPDGLIAEVDTAIAARKAAEPSNRAISCPSCHTPLVPSNEPNLLKCCYCDFTFATKKPEQASE
jgi:DNA repair exonuclease SbcCD ATPase subunit